MRKYLKSLAILAFVIILSGFSVISCTQAPVTGRSQFILLSEDQEIEMGLVAFQDVLKKENISKNTKYNSSVTRVGKRIAQASGKTGYKWEYKVIEADDTINAFALPGGKIAVYTGILKVAETEAGLATVMGHEVAHATARHGGERISVGILAQLGAVGLNVALRNKDPQTINAVNAAFGTGVTLGGILPFNRKQESEADQIGLIYMAKAGYDPRESVNFWKRMAKASSGKPTPPEFISTHPSHGTRITNLNKWIPGAMEIYKKSPKASSQQITLNK
ncbi:MAG TPA: M48 family metallopeptidase [Thermodesulfobacteriota bacterium]|jgi:predicted Zn-dependent protease|nr:M48 family metallopeptidase [Thermodesulfobacteriota bacterium]